MCRSIQPLFNFDPPASDAEIQAAAVQFVRKVSGFSRPARANQAACDRAAAEIAQTVRALLDALVTSAPAKNRVVVAAQARARRVRRTALSGDDK